MGRHKDATRQYDVLEKIVEYKRENGISPSIRELMQLTGVTSTSVMKYYLDRLEEEGLISRLPHFSRSIMVKGEFAAEQSKRPHLIYRALKMERNYLFYYQMRQHLQNLKVTA